MGVVSLPRPIGRNARPIRTLGGGDGCWVAGNGSTTAAAGAGATGARSSARAPAPSATNVRPIRVLVLRICFLSLIWSPLKVEGESKTDAVHLVVVRRGGNGGGLLEVSPRVASDQLDVELLEYHVLDSGEALPQPVVVGDDTGGRGEGVLVDIAGEETPHAEDERIAFAAVGDVGEPAKAGAGEGPLPVWPSLGIDRHNCPLRGVEAELDVWLEHELHGAADPL